MGFPFFAPAYIPGNRIRIYGCHARARAGGSRASTANRRFPVDFAALGADIEFVALEPGKPYDDRRARR